MPTSSQPLPRLRLVPGEGPRDSAASTSAARDAELVDAVQHGEVTAFESLYRRHAAFALNLAVRVQGSASDIEDLVHDAFLRAYERIQELRDGSAFRSWLGSIVVRMVRTKLRRRRLLAALGLASPEPVELDAIAAPDADPEARVLLAQVYSLLQTLSADERIAWTLRFVDNHQLEFVASLAGCSLATAKRRIARAQRYLSERFVAPFSQEDS